MSEARLQELRDAVIEAARVFCVSTQEEMDLMAGVMGLDHQVEFTELHLAVKELQEAETASYGRALSEGSSA